MEAGMSSFNRSLVSLSDLDLEAPRKSPRKVKLSPRKKRRPPAPEVEPSPEVTRAPSPPRREPFVLDRSGSFDSILERLQTIVEVVKREIVTKQRVLQFYRKEIENMNSVFLKVITTDKEKMSKKSEESQLPEEDPHHLSLEERMQYLQTGPFTIVFHGMEPDWIEEEMDDDPDFQRDVLELRIKKLFKEELDMIREIPLIDVFRYTEGPRINNATPVIVSFKNRKDKEQLMWRCKDKMKALGLLVTEDSMARLKKQLQAIREEEDKSQGRKSPTKRIRRKKT